jgi:hypothetical protein
MRVKKTLAFNCFRIIKCRTKIVIIIFSVFFFVPIFVFAQKDSKVFMVDVLWDKGEVSIEDVNVTSGFETRSESEALMSPARFNMKLMSADGEIISEKNFSFRFQVSVDPPLEDGASTFEESTLSKLVSFPYSDKASALLLFDANDRLVDQKIVQDKVEYVKEKKMILEDSAERNANKTISDAQVNKKPYIVFIAVGALALLCITLGLYLVFKKKDDYEQENIEG